MLTKRSDASLNGCNQSVSAQQGGPRGDVEAGAKKTGEL